MIERSEHAFDSQRVITRLFVDLPELGQVLVDTGHGRLPGPSGQPIPTVDQLHITLLRDGDSAISMRDLGERAGVI